MNETITLLLVDADPASVRRQAHCLGQHKIETIVLPDSPSGLDLGARHRPSGVICSADAAPAGAVAFCGAWRRLSDAPVMVCTARYDADEADAVRAAGAADYLSKSVAPPELVARVHAMLRRSASLRDEVRDVGAIRIDSAACNVCCAGRDIRTTATEFRILRGLAQSPAVRQAGRRARGLRQTPLRRHLLAATTAVLLEAGSVETLSRVA